MLQGLGGGGEPDAPGVGAGKEGLRSRGVHEWEKRINSGA